MLKKDNWLILKSPIEYSYGRFISNMCIGDLMPLLEDLCNLFIACHISNSPTEYSY